MDRALNAIYRKAGVPGAAALLAFFFRDLLFLAGESVHPRRSRDAGS